MKNPNTVLTSALASVIALSTLGLQSEAFAADKKDVEKCYGCRRKRRHG